MLFGRSHGLDTLRARIGAPRTGPCLVMGSAPTATVPTGYDSDWTLVCINASQVIAAQYGLPEPQIVMFRARLFGDKLVDREATQALRGYRAKTVVVRNLKSSVDEFSAKLREIDYAYDAIHSLSLAEYRAMVMGATRSPLGYLQVNKGLSAGVAAVMLALGLGLGPVVITGISLSVQGHFYSASMIPRNHVDVDRNALILLARQRWPLFTTDTALAQSVGVPVWTGDGR